MASFRKRADKWEYRIIYNDATGKRKEKTRGGFNTKKEAQIRASEVEKEINNQTYLEPTNMTLSSFIQEWIKLYANSKMRASSLASRTMNIEKHILPRFGKSKLVRIRSVDIQEYYIELSRSLSPATIQIIHN